MKKLLLLSVLSLLFPLSSFAYTSPFYSPPGSAGNPLYVEIEPTQSQKNRDMEASLKAQYGSTAFYSCMNRIPSCNGDRSDPSNQTACLQAVQYNFESRRCGASSPSLTCQAGYTMVNGSCVRESSQPIRFPIIVTPPAQPSLTIDQRCKIDYGPNSYGSGTQCFCSTSYEWTADVKSCIPSQPPLPSNCDTSGNCWGGGGSGGSAALPPKSNDQICSDAYGTYSLWAGVTKTDGTIECGCSSGYQFNNANTLCIATPKISAPESQAAAAISFEYRPSSTTSSDASPQKSTGFWSWLLGLFGF